MVPDLPLQPLSETVRNWPLETDLFFSEITYESMGPFICIPTLPWSWFLFSLLSIPTCRPLISFLTATPPLPLELWNNHTQIMNPAVRPHITYTVRIFHFQITHFTKKKKKCYFKYVIRMGQRRQQTLVFFPSKMHSIQIQYQYKWLMWVLGPGTIQINLFTWFFVKMKTALFNSFVVRSLPTWEFRVSNLGK